MSTPLWILSWAMQSPTPPLYEHSVVDIVLSNAVPDISSLWLLCLHGPRSYFCCSWEELGGSRVTWRWCISFPFLFSNHSVIISPLRKSCRDIVCRHRGSWSSLRVRRGFGPNTNLSFWVESFLTQRSLLMPCQSQDLADETHMLRWCCDRGKPTQSAPGSQWQHNFLVLCGD